MTRPVNGRWEPVRAFVWLGIRVLALVTIYVVLDESLRLITLLPESSYRKPVIGVELIRHLIEGSWIPELAQASVEGRRRTLWLCVSLLLAAVGLIRYPCFWKHASRFIGSWESFSHGRALRWLMAVPTVLATWLASTYDYNFLFDQPHEVDRLSLILLALLFIWRPIFVFPFLALLLGVFHQFSYPNPFNASWPELNLLIRALMLMGAALLIYGITGRANSTDLLLVLSCLIAAQYWGSGIGKFQLNWITHPHLHLVIFGAYTNGWLASWNPETIVRISQTFSYATIPLMIFTLFVEWGALLILCRRSVTLVFLASFVVFHLGVFAMTGMFFWKWIVLELAFAVFFLCVLRKHDELFNTHRVVLSMALVAASPFIFQPKNLSWYDTPVTYYRSFEAVGESGATYRLSPRVFTPYSDQATLGPFSCYSEHPQLTTIWGITSNRAVANALLHAKTAERVFAVEQELGTVLFDAERNAEWDAFFVQFLSNLNRRLSKETLLSPLQPPAHLWTSSVPGDFQLQERLVRVVIYEETYLYDGQQHTQIRRRKLREIELQLQPRAAPERNQG